MSGRTLSNRLAKRLAAERGISYTEALRRVLKALEAVGGDGPLDEAGRAEAYRRATDDA